jgi:hypothetical protein
MEDIYLIGSSKQDESFSKWKKETEERIEKLTNDIAKKDKLVKDLLRIIAKCNVVLPENIILAIGKLYTLKAPKPC